MRVLCGTHFATAMRRPLRRWRRPRPLSRRKNEAALDDHAAAPSTREFREKLGPQNGALYDDRRYKNLE
jgi:hypothetical protein